MKPNFNFALILTIALVTGERSHAESALSAEERAQAMAKTDEAYRTLGPSAPVSVPGITSAATPEELKLNETVFNHPQRCLFLPDDSNSLESIKQDDRTKIFEKFSRDTDRNAKSLLKACNEVKEKLGPKSCSVIELGGHGNGMSVGLGKTFGLRLTGGKWQRFPENDELFQQTVDCLKEISTDDAPFAILSCGAAHVTNSYPIPEMRGYLLYYAYRQEAQQVLANTLGRTVISALGPENTQEFGDHSRRGWYIVGPSASPSLTVTNMMQFLPVPQLQWDPLGKPLHSLPKGFTQADIDEDFELMDD